MRDLQLHRKLPLCLLLAAPLGLAACEKSEGGSTTPEPSTESGGGGETETPPPVEEAKTWSDMDRQARMEYMGTVVYPRMKTEFQGHDAERFGEFTCASCHGEDKEDVDFKMPNDLTPLPTEGTMEAATEMDAEIAKFMAESVVPAMQEMLGEGEEAGCFSCHLSE